MNDYRTQAQAEYRQCPACDGKGWRPMTWIREDPRDACTCERCHGKGVVVADDKGEL
jgi:DnaJ-class molecular chaperone